MVEQKTSFLSNLRFGQMAVALAAGLLVPLMAGMTMWSGAADDNEMKAFSTGAKTAYACLEEATEDALFKERAAELLLEKASRKRADLVTGYGWSTSKDRAVTEGCADTVNAVTTMTTVTAAVAG